MVVVPTRGLGGVSASRPSSGLSTGVEVVVVDFVVDVGSSRGVVGSTGRGAGACVGSAGTVVIWVSVTTVGVGFGVVPINPKALAKINAVAPIKAVTSTPTKIGMALDCFFRGLAWLRVCGRRWAAAPAPDWVAVASAPAPIACCKCVVACGSTKPPATGACEGNTVVGASLIIRGAGGHCPRRTAAIAWANSAPSA